MNDCETSMDQCGVREQPRSTYKRRSSVFQLVARRVEDAETTIPTNEDEAGEPEKRDEPCESDATQTDEAFDLPAYIEKLRSERKEWKTTLHARKSRRRHLQKQKATVQNAGADLDHSVLSESERSFLMDQPQYRRICRNIKILADAAVATATLNRELGVLNDRLTFKFERNLRNATKKVIAMSSET